METQPGSRLVWWRPRHLEEESVTSDLDTTVLIDLSAAAEPSLVRSPTITTDHLIFEPPFLGARVVTRILLDEVVGYVNVAEAAGVGWDFDAEGGERQSAQRRRFHTEMRTQLAAAGKRELFVPQVAYGYFPANSEGNDVIIWHDDTRVRERVRISFPRQSGAPNLCVADYVKPAGKRDFVALQIVTLGDRVSTGTIENHTGAIRDSYVRFLALGMALRDALAEYWHRRIRLDWGFADEDGPSLGLIFRGFYRGGRFPIAANAAAVVELLEADWIGVSAEGKTQLQPELTAAALIVHHPQAAKARL